MGLKERVDAKIGKTSPVVESRSVNYATKDDVDSIKKQISSESSIGNAIAKEQLRIIRDQRRKERIGGMVKVFRGTVEKLAAKPISHKESNEMMFGTKPLRNMTRKR